MRSLLAEEEGLRGTAWASADGLLLVGLSDVYRACRNVAVSCFPIVERLLLSFEFDQL